ncbi:Anaphase-promoting complex, subunit 3 family protein [Penicillium ucsense]|uniref:Anaphase-promoting complex, subunit 3 family protein n=1 Tax=Penicillium ucsense TaxID=2839758 RepID=A0A8J8W165_9EURO|nr:Anaphase-promoting complex, subunit 3 family protein [Penicillium ucsense]KAF7734076.1 Anaphase-promoting complex, subunit 3 family protein [Penicillium ucsense]
MEKYLRSWRQDALNRSQHDAAVYIGDKLYALTNSDSDAFWLAQVHFSNNNFTRALALLSRQNLIARSSSCRYLAANCYIKQNQFDQALSILGDQNPTDLIRSHNSRRKIQHLNGQSHVTLRNGKHTGTQEDRDKEEGNHVRFEAAMCYLRGLCFAKQNAFDRARDCYKDAVRIDVQCFEAFDQLMKNSLMSPTEELEFLESLDFDSISCPDPNMAQEAAHFTKMLYTTRLSKYSAPALLTDATETLSTHYNLSQNSDILLSRAEALYTQCRFAEALELTSSILTTSQAAELNSPTGAGTTAYTHLGHAPAIYPLHLACLYETGATNALFLLSHMLADHAPEEPYTYLAIGVYYLAVAKIAEARRFFSKASLLDPHSAPAWIGFAHTFAAEGEHDQAIAAYSTAARLFQGSHLPQLFLGMQHLALNNMGLAHDYLWAAYSMSTGAVPSATPALPPSPTDSGAGGDPLVLNELGVVFYHQNNLSAAVEMFQQALDLAASLHSEPAAWVATRANMGHALRRLGRLQEALEEFQECLRIGAGGTSLGYSPFLGGGAGGAATASSAAGVGGYEDRGLIGSLHTSRGIILMELGRTGDAVTALHEAVRVLGAGGGGDVAGGAGVAGTLLNRALELWSMEGREREQQQVIEGSVRSSSSRSAQRSREHAKGRERRGGDESNRRRIRRAGYAEEWTRDTVSPSATPEVADVETVEERVGQDLDRKAESLLGRVLGRVGPGSRQRRAQQQQRPVSPAVMDDYEDGNEPRLRSTRGERTQRSQSRQQ